MPDITPTNLYGPGGFQENKYVKTTRYQGVKLIRQLFTWFAIATAAIIVLLKDIIKGLAGK